jgi:hypothetical protein
MADFTPVLGQELQRGIGPLAKLNGSGFERTTLRYPLDLGAADRGHYVVFYARQQKDTNFKKTEGFESNFNGSPINYSSSVGGAIPSSAPASSGLQLITKKGLPTRTVLTTDAVALYMPDTIMYQQQQSYDILKPGTEFLGQLAAAGASGIEALESGQEGAFLKTFLKNTALLGGSQLAQKLGTTGELGFTAITGTVVNPILEMIYRSPNFRSFQFDFTFYPRSPKEALEVQNIIERLRFHQSPELVKNSEGFLIPPSEFDIVFYYNGKQNPNIPPVATCVLTDIQVNYAPNGWSAYEQAGSPEPTLGGTGTPIATQVTLQFQETTYLTKDDYRPEIALGTTQTLAP